MADRRVWVERYVFDQLSKANPQDNIEAIATKLSRQSQIGEEKNAKTQQSNFGQIAFLHSKKILFSSNV